MGRPSNHKNETGGRYHHTAAQIAKRFKTSRSGATPKVSKDKRKKKSKNLPPAPAPESPAPGSPALDPESPDPGSPVPGSASPGSPAPSSTASGSLAPGSPAPGSPTSGSPAPGSSAPGSPASGSPAPGSPASGSPGPGSPPPNGQGEERAVRCIKCLRSALMSRSDGACRDMSDNSAHCSRCPNVNVCVPIPPTVRPAAAEFFLAVQEGNKRRITRFRATCYGLLDIAEKNGELAAARTGT